MVLVYEYVMDTSARCYCRNTTVVGLGKMSGWGWLGMRLVGVALGVLSLSRAAL